MTKEEIKQELEQMPLTVDEIKRILRWIQQAYDDGAHEEWLFGGYGGEVS